MKVLVINISLRPNSEKILFPIGLGYIATAIEKAGFDFNLLDLDVLRPKEQELHQIIKEKDFDVAVYGCIVTGYRYVKNIAEVIKKYKDVPIIVGNSVATSIPELLMEKTKVDIGVVGEGDITIVELLRAIENKTPLENVKGIFFRKDGKIFFTETRECIANLNDLPMINYDLFDMETYLSKCKYNVSEPYPVPFDSLRALPVNTARGCLFQCTFCYHVFKKNRYRIRSIENVVKEIKQLQEKYGVNYVQFFDELTLFSKEQANKFAEGFLKDNLKVFWSADCRAGLFGENDLNLALKLKNAGCISLGYSLESADKEILKAMNKRITVEEFEIQTKILHKAGILPSTGIVIGYPQETEETIQRTFDCCYRCNIYPSTGYLLPQPGTVMYDYAIEHGIIKDEEEYLLKMGDRQDFTLNMTNMKQNKMEELVKQNLKRISDKLKLGLDDRHLIKTGHYKQKEHEDDGPEQKTKQLEQWEADFGEAYTNRNVIAPEKRMPAFREMLKGLKINKILEVGSNVGHNLVGLYKIGYKEVVGVEPMEYAVKKGRALSQDISILKGNAFDLPFRDNYFDLVFTAGVLIHIKNTDLNKAIDEIYRVSNRYILAVEYYAPEETSIHYRGHDDLLWKRDFKKIYLTQKPYLKCIREGVWTKEDGFEGCRWWLFEKRRKKTVVIVQARVTSSRLPNKVLLPIEDKPMLWWVLQRVNFCEKPDDIVLAIPDNKENDVLEEFAKDNNIKYIRGSEEDVLLRYYKAAKITGADVIVRITADCPIVDPEIVDEVIEEHLSSGADYTSNVVERSFPKGLDVEVFNFNVLERVVNEARTKEQREHVTKYILENPGLFELKNISANEVMTGPDTRLTVDTDEDLEFIRKIYKHFTGNPFFSAEEAVRYLKQN